MTRSPFRHSLMTVALHSDPSRIAKSSFSLVQTNSARSRKPKTAPAKAPDQYNRVSERWSCTPTPQPQPRIPGPCLPSEPTPKTKPPSKTSEQQKLGSWLVVGVLNLKTTGILPYAPKMPEEWTLLARSAAASSRSWLSSCQLTGSLHVFVCFTGSFQGDFGTRTI